MTKAEIAKLTSVHAILEKVAFHSRHAETNHAEEAADAVRKVIVSPGNPQEKAKGGE